MLRRTKIVATLGPKTDKDDVLRSILSAGVNVVRINFSHGDEKQHLARVKAVREYAKKNNTYIGVLMDLQGPKIRIAGFKNNTKIILNTGDTFTLDADLAADAGDQNNVGLDYKTLPKQVKVNDTLLLNDARIVMQVVQVKNSKIICTITQGGILSGKKGINLRGGGLSAGAITNKDKLDILTAAKVNADYVGLSFPTNGDDVRQAKKLLKKSGCDAGIITKIERSESLVEDVILDILQESAGIMVARGDLGVEIGDPLLPAEQKRLIKLARKNDRIVITATQMLESMITNPVPTRAEVFDVANAVLDGTDAVMLSAETAIGKFPKNAVKTMADICLETEKNPIAKTSHHRLNQIFAATDETIAMSAMYAANHLNVKAIASLTETGKTTLWMSRMSSNIPIFAMSDNVRTARKVTLYRGVYPCAIEKSSDDEWYDINRTVINTLLEKKVIKYQDLVILTKGMYKDKSGGTNTMKILCVGEKEY